MLEQKPVVMYRPISLGLIKVGQRATVVAIDHPSHLIRPFEVVHTSLVLEYDEDSGDFVTRNTFYRLSQD